MGLNKKDLKFFHFLAHLPQKVGDPCCIVYTIQHTMYIVQTLIEKERERETAREKEKKGERERERAKQRSKD